MRVLRVRHKISHAMLDSTVFELLAQFVCLEESLVDGVEEPVTDVETLPSVEQLGARVLPRHEFTLLVESREVLLSPTV